MPKQFSEEEISSLLDTAELDPPAYPGRTYPCCAVYFYTDLDNDECPSLFGSHEIELAKKAFEVVLLGLS